jgi:hypothetical protein
VKPAFAAVFLLSLAAGDCDGGGRCGTLFHLIGSRHDTNWTLTMVHAFAGGSNDGWDPTGSVVANRKALYGVTMYGGSGPCELGCGTIYDYLPSRGRRL